MAEGTGLQRTIKRPNKMINSSNPIPINITGKSVSSLTTVRRVTINTARSAQADKDRKDINANLEVNENLSGRSGGNTLHSERNSIAKHTPEGMVKKVSTISSFESLNSSAMKMDAGMMVVGVDPRIPPITPPNFSIKMVMADATIFVVFNSVPN